MEKKNEIRGQGALLQLIGGALSLFWAFDFVFGLHLPFILGFLTVGLWFIGRSMIKSQEKTDNSTHQPKNP